MESRNLTIDSFPSLMKICQINEKNQMKNIQEMFRYHYTNGSKDLNPYFRQKRLFMNRDKKSWSCKYGRDYGTEIYTSHAQYYHNYCNMVSEISFYWVSV